MYLSKLMFYLPLKSLNYYPCAVSDVPISSKKAFPLSVTIFQRQNLENCAKLPLNLTHDSSQFWTQRTFSTVSGVTAFKQISLMFDFRTFSHANKGLIGHTVLPRLERPRTIKLTRFPFFVLNERSQY